MRRENTKSNFSILICNMLLKLSFKNSHKQQNEREKKYMATILKKLEKSKVPDFCYGAKELILQFEEERKALNGFVGNWLSRPEDYLDYKKYLQPPIKKDSKNYLFKDFINKEDLAQFFESKQPWWGRGTKMAFIVVPHWNADFRKYKFVNNFTKTFFLPAASYLYFPKLQTEKMYKKGARYDIVSSNIGLTIKRVWQDVLNIQYFGNYLKENLGYDYVGLWTYSIGSLRGFLASIFSEIFDFCIMHFLTDSFTWAVLHGISTQDLSKELLSHISEQELEYLWSPLSPYSYEKYFNKLPRHTRLVQPKYDLVFGEGNNKRIVERFKKYAPFIDIEYGNFGHLTCVEIDKAIPSMYRTCQFVLNNSPLKFL